MRLTFFLHPIGCRSIVYTHNTNGARYDRQGPRFTRVYRRSGYFRWLHFLERVRACGRHLMNINEQIRDSVSWCRIYLRNKSAFYTYRHEKAKLDALWLVRSDLRKPDAQRRIRRRITGSIRALRNLRKWTSYSNDLTAEHLETQLNVFLSFRHI